MSMWPLYIFAGAIWIISAYDFLIKSKTLSTAHSIMFVAGLIVFAIAVIKPESIRYGDIEIRKIKKEAREAVDMAEDGARLAIESAAVSIWNLSRWGGMEKQEEVATELLKQVYGKDAEKVKRFLIQKNIMMYPEEKRKVIPPVKLRDSEVPLIYKLKENATLDDVTTGE